MRIIAFCGPKSSGKDTAARYLLARNSLLKQKLFAQHNFADTLKLSVELVFGYTAQELNDPHLKQVEIDRWPFKMPREILVNYANLLRTMYDPNIWVYAWQRRLPAVASTAACVIVTDLRHVEEVAALRERGAKIIYVDNPKVEEIRRQGIEAGDALWCDSSEALAEVLRKEADAIVLNDGQDLHALWGRVHQAVLQCYGDWKDWQELQAPDPNSEIIL